MDKGYSFFMEKRTLLNWETKNNQRLAFFQNKGDSYPNQKNQKIHKLETT